jgi:5-oxoprolinase (ATP-hydrolysing) subunit C
MTSVLEVLQAGPSVTVQDMGRFGQLGQGVGQGGAADKLALAEGAALLGQDIGCACLEMAALGGTFRATRDLRIALTGAKMSVDRDGEALRWNAAHLLKAGQVLSIGSVRSGVYGYLHVGGGLESASVLGSRSAHLLAGLGRAVQPDDQLPLGPDLNTRVGVTIDVADRTNGGNFRVVETPQTALFEPEMRQRFFATSFKRDVRANRMGVRVDWGDGAAFTASGQLSLVSDFALPGDIQMTGNGDPAVLLVEAQTTAGYPRIGTVIPCDLPRIAQASLGASIRFELVDRAAALGLQRKADAEMVALASRVFPLVRDPRDIPDLLSYQLIDGVISAHKEPEAP